MSNVQQVGRDQATVRETDDRIEGYLPRSKMVMQVVAVSLLLVAPAFYVLVAWGVWARVEESRRRERSQSDEQLETMATGEDKTEEDRIDEAVGLVMETAEALYTERGDREKLWGSMVKQALKRRRPGFNESYYGVRSFSALLEEAERRGLLGLSLDERSGGYVIEKLVNR